MTLASAAETDAVTGMWVTQDGQIRLEPMPNGRYDEARGSRRSACTGRYSVRGRAIDFADDSGFSATGRIEGGVLAVGPDRFRKE